MGNQRPVKDEEQILRLLEDGKTQSEIANIMGVSESAISKWIRKIDNKKVEDAIKKGQEKKNNEILKLIEDGKTQDEIGDVLGVSQATISRRMQKIESQKVEGAIKKGQEKKNNEILRLLEDGKTQAEIGDVIGVSHSTISRRMQKIESQKVEDAKKKKIFYEKIKQKLEERTITKDDIAEYRKQLDEKYDSITMNEIILMLKIYIKTMQASKAVSFINSIIYNEDIKHLNKDKLEEMKEEAIRIQKLQIVRTLLKDDMPTSEIAEQVKLSENEIIKVKRELESKTGQNR